MKQKYRIIMKDGSILRGFDVDHKPGFIVILSRDGEKRIPAGEVQEIYTSKLERGFSVVSALSVALIMVLLPLAIIKLLL